MIRLFLIDLIPGELKYYQFMISLNKCIWCCNSIKDLFMYSTTCDSTIYVPNKTKNVNVKVYNMMKNTLVKHISY